jgi:hypothetical protein
MNTFLFLEMSFLKFVGRSSVTCPTPVLAFSHVGRIPFEMTKVEFFTLGKLTFFLLQILAPVRIRIRVRLMLIPGSKFQSILMHGFRDMKSGNDSYPKHTIFIEKNFSTHNCRYGNSTMCELVSKFH